MAASYVQNDFYCINCGKKNLPLFRRASHLHEKFHRKRLYCFNCKQEINMVEVKNEEEAAEFLEMFERGEFKDEAEKSLSFVRNTRLGKT